MLYEETVRKWTLLLFHDSRDIENKDSADKGLEDTLRCNIIIHVNSSIVNPRDSRLGNALDTLGECEPV